MVAVGLFPATEAASLTINDALPTSAPGANDGMDGSTDFPIMVGTEAEAGTGTIVNVALTLSVGIGELGVLSFYLTSPGEDGITVDLFHAGYLDITGTPPGATPTPPDYTSCSVLGIENLDLNETHETKLTRAACSMGSLPQHVSGPYNLDGKLNQFKGKTARGEWILNIRDHNPYVGEGELETATLTITFTP